MMYDKKDGESMHTKKDYIAVFDSGVGGISVLRQLLKVLPNERYLYFGDSINAPYGVRTEEEVRQLTIAAAEKLTNGYRVVSNCGADAGQTVNHLRFHILGGQTLNTQMA